MSDTYTPEVRGLLDFLSASPTSFHAIAALEKQLQGFTRLEEGQPWRLIPGGRYYVTRNRSSLIAFVLPEGDFTGFQLIASHSDSPAFKVKENAEITVRGQYVQLDTERYGGAIFSTWLDRPLSVAGRVVLRDGGRLFTRLVNLERDMCVIPNVAIHMNREVNKGYEWKLQTDLFPLWGGAEAAGGFRSAIAEAAGATVDSIAGCDLFLYNRTPASVWGPDGCYLSAGRLDDLECAYTTAQGFLRAPAGGHVNVLCVFDNEEVGSTTRQGANSTFLEDTLTRISRACGKGAEEHLMALAGSVMLSADNAHAVHPNHPELSDPVNQAAMNGGVVLKFNANQKYTTDAVSGAVFHEICRRAGVPVQHYANRSDIAGGGTLGNISGSHVSIPTADIGLAQLAMHSAWETAGTRDIGYMIRAAEAFYSTQITLSRDGELSLQ